MYTMPKYSEEFHLELMGILNGIDPAHIANDNMYEYFHIAGFAMSFRGFVTDCVDKALSMLIDEEYMLTKEEKEQINEELSHVFARII